MDTIEEINQGLYDSDAVQTFAFEVTESGEKFETAHVFNPLTDERYLEYFKSLKADDDDEDKTNASEIQVALWRDLIKEVTNIEVEDGKDFRDELDAVSEIIPAIENYLAVAVVAPDKLASSPRKVGHKTEQTVVTEAFFNGTPQAQTHVLCAKSDEWSKKFNNIVKRQWKVEQTTGLRREAKVEFVPQNQAFGRLYDEMHLTSTGFRGTTPLRFKTVVLNYIFAPKLDPKKSPKSSD